MDSFGDDFVFEHGEVEGVAGEAGGEVGFYAAAHAFEDDEVGVGGGGVEFIGDLGEVDEGFAGAGGDEVDGEAGEGGFGLEDAGPPSSDIVDGHVVEGGALVGGENNVGAAAGEVADHGERAQNEIGAGVIDEEDGFAVERAAEDAGGEGVEVVDEPGAMGETFAGGEEIRAGVEESVGGGFGAHIEDVAGENAFDDGAELLVAVECV